MTEIAQFVSDRWETLRMGAGSQWVWRLSLAVLVAGCLITSGAWAAWPWAGFMVWTLGIGLGLGTVAAPDSIMVGAFLCTIIGWWLLAGRPQVWWQPACEALLLGALHLVAAGAAAGPFYAPWSRGAVKSWARSAAVVLVLTVVALGLTLVAAQIPASAVPRGPVWIVLALLGTLGAALWAIRSCSSAEDHPD